MSATPRYLAGLDLGQAQDCTALAVLKQAPAPAPLPAPGRAASERPLYRYAVRHLERFPLGTPYTDVCARLVALFAAPPLAGGTLAVDQTGVGRPVLDLLRRAQPKAAVTPVTITAGHRASPAEAGGWHVPKKELVSILQVLLQSRRVQVSAALAEAAALVGELRSFQVRVTASAQESFGSWREGSHDDLVLAVALAAWAGEQRRGPWAAGPPPLVAYRPAWARGG